MEFKKLCDKNGVNYLNTEQSDIFVKDKFGVFICTQKTLIDADNHEEKQSVLRLPSTHLIIDEVHVNDSPSKFGAIKSAGKVIAATASIGQEYEKDLIRRLLDGFAVSFI